MPNYWEEFGLPKVGDIQLPAHNVYPAKSYIEVPQKKVEKIEHCGLLKSRVEISIRAHVKVTALLKEFKGNEWFAYLKGHVGMNGAYVSDIVVPEQDASGASVDNIKYPQGLITIGTIHCHPWENGTWFSGIDQSHTVQNHPLNIVVSSKHQYKALLRRKAACRREVMEEVPVVVRDVQWDTKNFIEDAKKKIKTHTYHYNEKDNKINPFTYLKRELF